MNYVRAQVQAGHLVRDVLTRESVEGPGEVTLLVRIPGEPLPRCPRHPKRGVTEPKAACLCHGTLIDDLVAQGVITDVKPHDPAKPEAKAKN
jgi:hypothetical protein